MRWTSFVWILALACNGRDETDSDEVDETDADADTDADSDTDTDADTDSDTDTDTDTDTDSDTADRPDVDVVWDSYGVTVTLTNIPTSGFDFGIAETADMTNGWFGEDCFNGTGGYNVCHVFNGTKIGELESIYDEVVGGSMTLDDVVGGSTTLFEERFADANRLTYVVIVDSGECWVFGHDPSYYLDAGPFSGCRLLPP